MVAIAVSIRHVKCVEDWHEAPPELQAKFRMPCKIVSQNYASFTGLETPDAIRGWVQTNLCFGPWREVGSARTVNGWDTVQGRKVDIDGLLDDMQI